MANIKSAKKRILVSKTRNERNKAIKSAVKTAMKKVDAAVAAKDKEAASAALLAANTRSSVLTRLLPRVCITRTTHPEKYPA